MSKVAKLVTITLKTRVIVDVDASEEEIMQEAKSDFQDKLDNDELIENLDSIEDDEECPFSEEDE